MPHIYAVGDVIGFPSLASTSLEQGRLAACHAFGIAARSVPALVPYAIWDTHELLGVHIIGEGASELIHIGQAVMAYRGSVEHFVEAVFNYPTLAECYKTAALDGLNRLDSWQTTASAEAFAP